MLTIKITTLRQGTLLLLLLHAAGCRHLWGAQNRSDGAGRYALLIGISTYAHTQEEMRVNLAGVLPEGRFTPKLTFANLKGPLHDVEAMQAMLERFGFASDINHMGVLLDQEAKRAAIMAAMQHYLVDLPQEGDHVVLYISGHGSLRVYPPGTSEAGAGGGELYNVFHNSSDMRRVENTIVPYDWYTGADDVFSRDLRHIFREAVKKKIHVTAILDACHSGSLSRDVEEAGLVSRSIPFDTREMPKNDYAMEESGPLPQDDPDYPVLVLSAALKDQTAIDDQTLKPEHGAFTAALLEAVAALPADWPVDDVFRRVQVGMELRPNSLHQQPQMDASDARRQLTLFGMRAAVTSVSATVLSTGDAGIKIDIGTAADIGVGSRFKVARSASESPVMLEVTQTDGPGRSYARVVSPIGATVQAGELLELVAGVPWQRPVLLFFAGAANLSSVDLERDVAAVRASPVVLVGDPSRDAWSYHLFWQSDGWVLAAHSGGPAERRLAARIMLGRQLTPSALRRIHAGSTVWFDPPLAEEAASLLPPAEGGQPHLAAHLTGNRAEAKYVLGSRLVAGAKQPEYAWFKRDDVDTETQTPPELGDGCSPHSGYPLRTEWSTGVDAATKLNEGAVQLARLNGWFLLESSSLVDHEQFPYTLALRPDAGGPDVVAGGRTPVGMYHLVLQATEGLSLKTTPQWVYVISVNCQGKGRVSWPYDARPPHARQEARKFPTPTSNLDTDESVLEPEIILPGDAMGVGEPLGTDTYLLLTTSTPLSDYHALEFRGVVTTHAPARAAKNPNPLEDLLEGTSSGARLTGTPIPTDWGLWSMQVESVPR